MLSENKIVGEFLEIKSEDIVDYFLPAGQAGKVFISKRLPSSYFPYGL